MYNLLPFAPKSTLKIILSYPAFKNNNKIIMTKPGAAQGHKFPEQHISLYYFIL
jgi:hypothetical protein